MWTKFTAPSDLDYWEQGRRTGLERSCTGCGDPVLVDRDETYAIQVWCPACLEKEERESVARRTAEGSRRPAGSTADLRTGNASDDKRTERVEWAGYPLTWGDEG